MEANSSTSLYCSTESPSFRTQGNINTNLISLKWPPADGHFSNLTRVFLTALMIFVSIITNAQLSLLSTISANSDGYPDHLINLNGKIIFTANDGVHGRELWVSDGTSSGTQLLKDINSGSNWGVTTHLFQIIGSALFFSANDGVTGEELWKTDGTTLGTMIVKDIFPGSIGGMTSLSKLVELNGQLYFMANDVGSGSTLWKSDGTSAGTIAVTTKATLTGFALYPADFIKSNNALFINGGGTAGSGLFKFDGTTLLFVKQMNVGFMFDGGSFIYFLGDNYGSTSNQELWRSDGTNAGTLIVKDINPSGSSNPQPLVYLNGILYFSATHPSYGSELWRSNGTDAGTLLVKDLYPGVSSGFYPSPPTYNNQYHEEIVSYNNNIYFTGYPAAGQRGLYKSDGTDAGTQLILAGTRTTYNFKVLNNKLYFTGGGTTYGLKESDGTPSGTYDIAEVTFEGANDYSLLGNNMLIGFSGVSNSGLYNLVLKNNQYITFNAIPIQTSGNAPFALNAIASSGLPVTYTSSDNTVATISGNVVTITGAGTCTITAKQAGDATYNAALDVPRTLTVNFAAPTTTAATSITSTGFTANWNAVTGATGYQLDISMDNFTTFVTGYNSKVETGTSDVVTGLTPGKPYGYRVRATKASGSSPNSNVQQAITLNANGPVMNYTLIGYLDSTKVSGPMGVAFDASSNLYVSSGFKSSAVVKVFDKSDTYLRSIGSAGTGPGQFQAPAQLAVDHSGNVFVADWYNGTVQVFDNTGAYVKTIGGGTIAIANDLTLAPNGNLYITDGGYDPGLIDVYKPDGTFVTTFSKPGNSLIYYGLAVDAGNNSYITEYYSKTVQVFNSSNSFVRSIGSGYIGYPMDVKVDANGNVYIADFEGKVQIFDNNGNYLYTLDGSTGKKVFNGVAAIAINSNGTVIAVADVNNNLVQVFGIPNITISQNNATIPSAGAFDFGNVNMLSNSGSIVFNVQNTGTAALNINLANSTLTVANASDFVVDLSALNTGISPGGSSQVKVTFTPSAPSVRTAIITVASNDLAQNPYVINLKGTGVQVSPVATAATTISSTGFTANWNSVPGATGYQLDISTDNFATFVTGYNSKAETGTSDVVTGLTAATAYQYRVHAVNASLSSANSNTITVTTAVAGLAAPVAAAATATSSSGFTANWNAVTGATGYQLDISTDNFVTFITGYSSKAETGTTDVVTGLIAGTTYQYQVRAVNASGTSASSNVISVTTSGTAPLPAVPVAIAATSVSATGFTANWNSVAGATGYQLDISSDNFATFVTGYNSKIETGTSDIVTGLTTGTTYQYRVRATNAAGTSASSNGVSVTPSATGKSDQTITFAALADVTVGDANFNLGATASSGLAVSYATNTPKVTLNGNVVTIVSAGRDSITASQAGNTNFNAATPVKQSFCIKPAKPTITETGDNTATPILTSSAASGNQWFLNGTAISGATNTSLSVTAPGVYTVQAKVDDCQSAVSTNFAIIVTGDIAISKSVALYPNPTKDFIFVSGIKEPITESTVVDAIGRSTTIKSEKQGDLLKGDVSNLSGGMYILKIQEGTQVHFIKFIKQ